VALRTSINIGDFNIIDGINNLIRSGEFSVFRRVTLLPEQLPSTVIAWNPNQQLWIVLVQINNPGTVAVDGNSFIIPSADLATAEDLVSLFTPPPGPGYGPIDDEPTIPESRVRTVEIPSEIRKALHALQSRGDNVEYGGGIDFELVAAPGEGAMVEKLIAFLGQPERVPAETVIRFSSDVEVEWHTHPNRKWGNPSRQDLVAFSSDPQTVHIIIANDDLLILSETVDTPQNISHAEIERLADEANIPELGMAIVELTERAKSDRFLTRVLNYRLQRVARRLNPPVKFDLRVI